MTRLVLALVLALVACSKADEPKRTGKVPALSEAEIQRSQDACNVYVTKACACANENPAAKEACDLARALPDAVRMDLGVAGSPESKPQDVYAAQNALRQTVKECIEQTAKLPCQ